MKSSSIKIISVIIVLCSVCFIFSACSNSASKALVNNWFCDEIITDYPVKMYLYEDGKGEIKYFPTERSTLFSEDIFNWEVKGNKLLFTHDDVSERKYDRTYDLIIQNNGENTVISLDGHTYHIMTSSN